jgi:hypothetical protein
MGQFCTNNGDCPIGFPKLIGAFFDFQKSVMGSQTVRSRLPNLKFDTLNNKQKQGAGVANMSCTLFS